MNARTLHILLLITLVGALLVGCGTKGEVQVGVEDNGGTVEIDVGEVLIISLESNPTTGYSWHVESVDAGVLAQKGEAEFDDSDSEDLVGAPGVEIYRFEARKPGETSLTLLYYRSWEKDVPPLPLETFGIQVIVH